MKKQKLLVILSVVFIGFALLFGVSLFSLDSASGVEKPEGLGTWIWTVASGLGAILTALIGLANFLKEGKNEDKPAAQKDEHVQEMQDSAFGEQSMKGKGGVQKQTMKNSIGGKQKME